MNTLEEHAGGHPGFTAEDTASMMAGMVADPLADTVLVFEPGGKLVAGAVTTTPPKGGFRIDLLGGVVPQWRGRGLGRELFGQQLARAAAIHQAQAPDAAWEVHVGAMFGDDETVHLYERFGLTPARYWLEMLAPTADAAELALPDGMRAQTYAAEHAAALYDAHVAAFTDHWGSQQRPFEEWKTLTVRSEAFLPDLSLLAFSGDELTGYVLSYTDADPKRLYVGQVGVRRQWRRRGLAGSLLAQVLGAAGGAGYTNASLGVDADSPTGAVGVYERVGFGVEQRWVTYRLPLGEAPRAE